jgi:hypothetical protein
MRLRALAGALAAGLFLTAACGESRYRYISSSETQTYLKVPRQWRVFDEDEVLGSDSSLSPQQADEARSRQYVVAFDASPTPALNHIDIPGRHPAGLVQVVALSEDQRDSVSLKVLRAQVAGGTDPLEAQANGDPNVEVVSYEDVTRAGGIHGIHLVVNLRPASGQEFVTTNYLGLVDTATKRLYLLFVGCRATCYAQHKAQIEDIVHSWTVRER